MLYPNRFVLKSRDMGIGKDGRSNFGGQDLAAEALSSEFVGQNGTPS